MPFIEVFDFDATPAQRETANHLLTDALCGAYGISPEIVSAYFFDVGDHGYRHGGKFHEKAAIRRIFIKLHAFSRSHEARCEAAELLTGAAVRAYGVAPKAVVVYFLDRAPDEAAHGGVLESLKQT